MLSASKAVRPTAREATCLRCEARMLFSPLRIPSSSSGLQRSQSRKSGTGSNIRLPVGIERLRGSTIRSSSFHTSSSHHKQQPSAFAPSPKHNARLLPANVERSSPAKDPAVLFPASVKTTKSIRQRLFEWNEKNGQPGQTFLEEQGLLDPPTLITRMQSPDDLRGQQDGEDSKDNSMDEASFQENQQDYDSEVTRKIKFHMGDLVELATSRFSRDTQLAVSLGPAVIGNFVGVFITSRGRWLITNPQNAVYRLQEDFAPIEKCREILKCIPHHNLDPNVLDMAQSFDLAVSREVSAPVISKMQEFKDKAEETYRLNSKSLDAAHDILAHQTDLRFGSLEKIAQKLLSKRDITVNDLFVIRKALNRSAEGFSFDARSHKETGMFQIRSKETTEAIKLAQAWIRDWREQLVMIKAYNGDVSSLPNKTAKIHYLRVQSFIDKAASIIDTVRETRHAPNEDPTTAGPSKTRLPTYSAYGSYEFKALPQFSADDVVLIRFLETWSMSDDIDKEASLSSLPPSIIRATGKYENVESGKQIGLTFLAEIGVFEPWVNKQLYSNTLLLPMSQHSKPLQQLSSTLSKMTLKDVEMKDAMEELRHDWGDMPAFAIDEAGAEEIDDAVSVERVQGKHDEYWVHAHIANPTSFLKPDSIFTRMAAHLTETFYSPERKFSMLPAWLSRDALGLAKGRPCLTFSSRVNADGRLLETKIRNGTIQNVISLTYINVADILRDGGPLKPTSAFKISVGDNAKGRHVTDQPTKGSSSIPELDMKAKADLKLLADIAAARHNYRVDEHNEHAYLMNHTGVRVWSKQGRYGLLESYPHRTHPVNMIGDPCIELTSSPLIFQPRDHRSGSNLLVQEAMILTGESAALWLKQRNIPSFFRSTDTKVDPGSVSQEVYLEKIWNPSRDENGLVPYSVAVGYRANMGENVVSAYSLQPHQQVGLEQYQKVTSPLRRYGDMVIHYQIESALRHEARTGKQFNGLEDASALAFGEKTIVAMTARLLHREALIRYETGQCSKHWVSHFIFRALYYNEHPLPKRFNVLIDYPTSDKTSLASSKMGWVIDMGFRVRLQSDEQMDILAQCGDVFECEWFRTQVYFRTVFVKPIRRVCEGKNLNQWLKENPPSENASLWTGGR